MPSFLIHSFLIAAFGAELLAPVPEKAIFVGCRPSPGECHYSCPNLQSIAVSDRELCDPEDAREALACYCLPDFGEFR